MIDGCEKRLVARGYCTQHYQRWRKHGDPLVNATLRGAPVGDRFAHYVLRGDGESCYEWQSSIGTNGYGLFYFRGRSAHAHRVAWELANGPIPDGLFVCHHCDNPRCVRVDHLFLGTPEDNIHDMLAKGRARFTGPRNPARGERHGFYGRPDRPARGTRNAAAKISEITVRLIRSRCDAGETKSAVARDLGLGRNVVTRVARRETWQHVSD